jgi:methylated-DNA-protein-cysteine methyltransferase-like protein
MAGARVRSSFTQRVELVVRHIPKGTVATYGQVAALAGFPRAARMVGWVLRHSHQTLPWQRVMNREGRLSILHEHLTAKTQAALLEHEGVKVHERDDTYWVDLRRFLWHPR